MKSSENPNEKSTNNTLSETEIVGNFIEKSLEIYKEVKSEDVVRGEPDTKRIKLKLINILDGHKENARDDISKTILLEALHENLDKYVAQLDSQIVLSDDTLKNRLTKKINEHKETTIASIDSAISGSGYRDKANELKEMKGNLTDTNWKKAAEICKTLHLGKAAKCFETKHDQALMKNIVKVVTIKPTQPKKPTIAAQMKQKVFGGNKGYSK